MTKRFGVVGAVALGITIGWACDGEVVGRMLHDAGDAMVGAGGGSGGGNGGPSDAAAQGPVVRTATCETQLGGRWVAVFTNTPISQSGLRHATGWACGYDGIEDGPDDIGDCMSSSLWLDGTTVYAWCGSGDPETTGFRRPNVTVLFD